jgi:hypothetical protein
MWADGQRDRQTDMTYLIDAFRTFANAPKIFEERLLESFHRHLRCQYLLCP